MLLLDVPTMLLMTTAAALTMAVALLAVRPERREGLSLWAAGLTLSAATYVLYALRGAVSDWLSVVLANVLLSGSLAMVLAAVHQFQGRALPWRRMLVPVLAVALLFAWFIDDYRARIMAASVVLPLQIGMVLWSLWRYQPPEPKGGIALLSAGLVLEAVLIVMRGAIAATHAIPLQGIMQADAMQSVTFMAAFVVVVLASLGFILMAKERSDADNRYHASHDALTGLANRRFLIQTLTRDLARAVRLQEHYAVLMVDIDHFKAVNDTHGHPVGDEVLQHVAGLLRARLRAQDLVGRSGGEEFLVLLPGASPQGALQVAESLRASVAQSPLHLGGRDIGVSVSIGVCSALAQPGDDWSQLVQRADQALYAAKQGGRNRVECVALRPEGASARLAAQTAQA